MSLVLAGPAGLVGAQTPRVSSVPPYVSTAGREAVELAAMAGLVLDPWQALVLEQALGEREDGRWAAFEVGVVVSRQNGKGSLLEARALAGLFLLNEKLIVWSAHQFDTSLEAFRRLLALVEDTPDLDRRVKRVSRSHGEEGIELKGGQRIRFRTRTKGGGRGFTGDCVIFDEAMILPEVSLGAVLPIVSARPNPQVWYTGSAVDQFVHEDGIVLARVRERGLKGGDPRLAYFEWSHDAPNPDDVEDPLSLEAWVQANPALGIRISSEHVEAEQRSLAARTFAVERLGVGDWPMIGGAGNGVIDLARWAALKYKDHAELVEGEQYLDPSVELDPLVFVLDTNHDRSITSIAAVGRRPDGLFHVEVVARERGTGWVVDRLVALAETHDPAAIVCASPSPADSLIQELEQRGIKIETLNSREVAQACGFLQDTVAQAGLRHLGTPELTAALKGAATRPMGDDWVWSRRNSSVDTTPIFSVTLGLWVAGRPKSPEPMVRFT